MKDIPAFPVSFKWGKELSQYNGMNLRDYFAAQALTGAQIWDAVINEKNAQLAQGGAEKLSDIAYAVADAMMKAREA
jgi:hypothetical protein